MHFDGTTFSLDRDGKRLGDQYLRVFGLMRDGLWRSLADISSTTKDPVTSVSARLRDMRKERFGGFEVKRRHVSNGLYQYQLNVKATH